MVLKLGFIVIIGKFNVGKLILINVFIGEKIVIILFKV